MLDMASDRRSILFENENWVDISIWRQFGIDLTLYFGYTTKKQQISRSADVGIEHQINIDTKHWTDIEFWSPDVAN